MSILLSKCRKLLAHNEMYLGILVLIASLAVNVEDLLSIK